MFPLFFFLFFFFFFFFFCSSLIHSPRSSEMSTFDVEDANHEPLTHKQGNVLFFFNALLALAHAAQGIAILVLSRNNPAVIPILFVSEAYFVELAGI